MPTVAQCVLKALKKLQTSGSETFRYRNIRKSLEPFAVPKCHPDCKGPCSVHDVAACLTGARPALQQKEEQRIGVQRVQAPGKEDVVGVIKVTPGLVLREGLAALAEGRVEGIASQAGHCVAYARLCAVSVVHIKVQQSHPLDACHSPTPCIFALHPATRDLLCEN